MHLLYFIRLFLPSALSILGKNFQQTKILKYVFFFFFFFFLIFPDKKGHPRWFLCCSSSLFVRLWFHIITKTRLFKYIENLTTKKGKLSD